MHVFQAQSTGAAVIQAWLDPQLAQHTAKCRPQLPSEDSLAALEPPHSPASLWPVAVFMQG